MKWACSGLPDFPGLSRQRGRARRRRRRPAPGPRCRRQSNLQVAAQPGIEPSLLYQAYVTGMGGASGRPRKGFPGAGRGGAGPGPRLVGTRARRRACGGACGCRGGGGMFVPHGGRQCACGSSLPSLHRGLPSRAGPASSSPRAKGLSELPVLGGWGCVWSETEAWPGQGAGKPCG